MNETECIFILKKNQSHVAICSLNRFTSDTGRKDPRENYAFLPTKLAEDNNGNLTIVSWNYRIMCHPLKDDLPLNRLRTVDDLATRLANKLTPAEYETSPGARYQVSRNDNNNTFV